MLLPVNLEVIGCSLKGIHKELRRPLEMRGGPSCLWCCNDWGPCHWESLPEAVKISAAALGVVCWRSELLPSKLAIGGEGM